MREFDSREQAQSQDPPPLVFSSVLDCPSCDEPFEATWVDASMTVEDMVDAPVEDQKCPSCSYVLEECVYPGWTFFSEA